jgi:exopolysaccharide production protein ExoZ
MDILADSVRDGMKSHPAHKVAAIQNLRGISVILTVFAHEPLATEPLRALGLPGIYWMGVCVFYGISGYVIALTTENKGWDYLSSFYIRRLFRIMPVMLLSCAIAILFALALPRSPIVDQFYPAPDVLIQNVAAQTLLIGNFAPLLGVVVPHSLAGLWTISTEAQFYFSFGGSLWLTKKRRAAALLTAAIGLFALKSWLFPALALHHAFFFEVLIVAACACSVREHIRPNLLLIALAAGFVMMFPLIPKTISNYLIAYPILTVAISYIVVCAGHEFRILNPKSAASRFLYWTGERSYVIYVFHFQVLAISGLVLQMTGVNYGSWWAYAILLMATPILAAPLYELIHKAIEIPGIEFGKRYAMRV